MSRAPGRESERQALPIETTPAATQEARAQLAPWLVPPAAGWRRKSVGLVGSKLFLPLVGLAAVLYALGILGLLMVRYSAQSGILLTLHLAFLLAGVGLLGLILYRVQHYLLEPLAHLRNWALRMRGGSLSARIPVPASAELARDINSLGEGLKTLSHDLDNQVRKQTERLAQKTRTLEILYDVAASINMSRDLDDLLTLFLHTLKDLVNARAASVRLLTDDGQMRLVASIGLASDVVERESVLPMHRCLCGSAAAAGEVRFESHVRQCHGIIGRPLLDNHDVEIVAVPLQYQARTLGVYNLFVDTPGLAAREDMQELLTSIGRHLGMAIEKARLDEEAKQLTLMQERAMLAHELHDSLAQTLHSLRFQVKMLDETLQQDGAGKVGEEIRRIKSTLEQANTELRELLGHFRAPVDQRTLAPPLEDMVARFRNETGILAFLQKECDLSRLPSAMERQVLRIIQEALSNVRKHSQAHAVRLLLRSDDQGQYRVLVEDDGVGLDERAPDGPQHPGEHVGLCIMQERARCLGGDVRVESEPGEGTRVLLTFRYPQNNAAATRELQQV
jgi:two-component system, NarL family, nitrate/nitrite sensor histidine kinase NarX